MYKTVASSSLTYLFFLTESLLERLVDHTAARCILLLSR